MVFRNIAKLVLRTSPISYNLGIFRCYPLKDAFYVIFNAFRYSCFLWFSMAKYDENLRENPFYCFVKERHCNVLQRAAEENWLICIPRKGTVTSASFCQLDVLKHTLVPDKCDDTIFTTLTDQRVSLQKDSVITDQSVHDKSEKKKKVGILFFEVFYEQFGKYRLVCLECPLFSDKQDEILPSILTIQDAITFLCQGLQNFAVMNKLDSLAQDLNLKYKKISKLDDLIEVTYSAYQLGHSLVMNQASFKVKVSADPYQKKLIELSVITYLQHKIFPSLITVLNVLASENDAVLNFNANNAASITCSDLNISFDAMPLSNSMKELKAFFKFHTFIDKIGCLKKSATVSCSENSCVTSDELLPYLCYVIVKSCMPNWYAHVMFLKHFQSDCILRSSESYFYLTTLEAALEFICSGGLFMKSLNVIEDKKEDSGQFLLKSEAEKLFASCHDDNALAQYFGYIQHSKCVEILDIFEGSSVKSGSSAQEQLCHPLCRCSNCSSRDHPKSSSITPMSRDSQDRSGLHIACIFGCPKVIKLLLSKGADINAKDNQGNTPLHFAAMKGHKNCVLLLLHNGAKFDQANSCGSRPLHLAAENGHTGCIKGLLFYAELHGSINCMSTNNNGDTPLHLACKWGFKECIITLLDQMKDGSYNILLRNHAGFSPLDVCANQELYNIVLNSHEQYGGSGNSSPRFEGCHKKRPSLDSGCVSQSSPTAISSVVSEKSVENTGAFNSSKSLVVRPEVISPSTSLTEEISHVDLKSLDTAIEALKADNVEKTVEILALPITTSNTTSDDPSLCHPLCQCTQCSKLLPEKGSGESHCSLINSLGSDGLSILHVATTHGHKDFVKLLLCNNCDPNLLSGIQGGCATALHIACEIGNYDIAEMLVSHGADVDAIDISGNTALHLAAVSGHGRLLDLLLKSGANTSAINYEGQLPEDIAREFGYLAAVEMLLQPANET